MTSNETRPVVSDEDIARIIVNTDEQMDCLFGDDPGIDENALNIARKVREALAAAVPPVVIPEIPDGWFLANLEYRDQWGDYLAELWDESVLPLGDSCVEARNVDPWKALQAAIDAVKAEVAS